MVGIEGHAAFALALAQDGQFIQVRVVQLTLYAKAAQRITLPFWAVLRPREDVGQGLHLAPGAFLFHLDVIDNICHNNICHEQLNRAGCSGDYFS